jgi:hypothetical protein
LNEYSPAGIVTYRSDAATVGGTVLRARGMCEDATVIFGLPDTFWTGDGQDSLLRPVVQAMTGIQNSVNITTASIRTGSDATQDAANTTTSCRIYATNAAQTAFVDIDYIHVAVFE